MADDQQRRPNGKTSSVESKRWPVGWPMGMGLALGAGIGAAFGAATGEMEVWLGTGLAIGIVFGGAGTYWQVKKQDGQTRRPR